MAVRSEEKHSLAEMQKQHYLCLSLFFAVRFE